MAKHWDRENCWTISYWFRVPGEDVTTTEHDQHQQLFPKADSSNL
jgi:hypothetical protein